MFVMYHIEIITLLTTAWDNHGCCRHRMCNCCWTPAFKHGCNSSGCATRTRFAFTIICKYLYFIFCLSYIYLPKEYRIIFITLFIFFLSCKELFVWIVETCELSWILILIVKLIFVLFGKALNIIIDFNLKILRRKSMFNKCYSNYTKLTTLL